MRRFFEPASAPAWLKAVLSSIRAALGDIWDVPLRPFQAAAADLPAAADFAGGLAYNLGSLRITWSDGTSWVEAQPYDADLAAIAALSTTGLVARTGAGAFALRSITGTANQINVANGGGVLGNPTLALASPLTTPGDVNVPGQITLSGAGGGLALNDRDGSGPVYALFNNADTLNFYSNAAGTVMTMTGSAFAVTGTITAASTITQSAGAGTGTVVIKGGNAGGANVGQLDYERDGSGVVARIETIRDGANAAGTMIVSTKPAAGALTERLRIGTDGITTITGASAGPAFRLTGGAFAGPAAGTAGEHVTASDGLVVYANGSGNDFVLCNSSGSNVVENPHGTRDLSLRGGLRQAGSVIARFENSFSSLPNGFTGAGIELGIDTGVAIFQSYNRTAGTYLTANHSAAAHDLIIGGTSISLAVSSGGITVNGANAQIIHADTANDSATKVLIKGTAKGVRIGTTASRATIEGVDNTGVGSYQPLHLGGNQVILTSSGTDIFFVRSTGVAATNIDDSHFPFDASGNERLGFMKKSGALPRIAFGSGQSVIFTESNVAGIAASNTFTDRVTIDANGISLASGRVLKVNSTQVVGARKTGWSTATGTATRTSFDTGTVTLSQLAERVKALIDDLHGTAGHGLIGT